MVKRTKKLFEDIENYLDESLDSKGRIHLKEQLENYSDLYLEVDKHRQLKEALSDSDTLAFKEKLIAIGEELKSEEKKVKQPLFNWRIAATLLIIVGLGSYFVINSLSVNNADLYTNYFTIFPLEETARGDNNIDSIGNLLKDRFKAYREGNYKAAILNLEKLKIENPVEEVLKIYLGNSYLQTDQINNAITEFQSIDSLSRYYENAQWYLALSFLKTNQEVETRKTLKKLLKYNGAYNNKASDLLKELN